MKILAIVQARMGSTRFPGKVMKTINDMPMIQILLHRLSKSKLLTDLVVATTTITTITTTYILLTLMLLLRLKGKTGIIPMGMVQVFSAVLPLLPMQ